jgi:hypothetical protein
MATFVSPGVYTSEQDFSVFASQLGITRLGLVGQTTKGPAFTPIQITSTDEYAAIFGTTDTNIQLPYVANSFLGQSQFLTVTRILGQEGYTNSPAWIIMASTATHYSGTTTASGMTFTDVNSPVSVTYTFVTSAATAGVALNSATATTVGNVIDVAYSGASVTTQTWLNAINATAFSGFGITVAGASSSIVINSGATQTISLSANTFSTNVANGQTVFIGDNAKRSDYIYANAFSATTAFTALQTLVTT